jgi:hypothetical protein
MERAEAADAGRTFDVVEDVPGALGWRRRADLDEKALEAWELRDGSVLLLDPTGASDARIHRPRVEAARPSGPFLRRATDERRASLSAA